MDFSVVIPVYNAAHTLERAVKSVLAQTYTPAEIVVVDDGSTDDPTAVLQPYLDRVCHIPMLHQGIPAAARNRGIAETTCDYVAFLDADDWWHLRHLECVAQAFARRPTAGLCYGNFNMVDKQGRMIRKVRARSVDGDGYAALLKYDFIGTSTVVVPRACLDQVGVFSESEDIVGCEDWELWLRVARHHPLVHLREPLVVYQVHGNEESLATGSAWLQSFQTMKRIILEELEGGEKHRVASWHDYLEARWHLIRGNLDEARHLMDQSTNRFRRIDRRWLFWLLTRGSWAIRLPNPIRRRLGIGTQVHQKQVTSREG